VGIDDSSRARVAVKIIDKRRLDVKLLKKVRHEIHSLQKLSRHPNIVGLKEVFENDQRVCLVLEYCSQGELFDLIVRHGRVSRIA
jgi:serine/threonine protein kinase